MKVIIDSGHGGNYPGAIAFGVEEKNLNLVFARLLANKLESLNINVDKSLINDKYYTPVQLTDAVKKSGASLCISCHNNSFDGTASGFEVIHSIHSDGSLAKLIEKETAKTGYPIRRVFSRESSNPANKGKDYYYIIKLTHPQVETIIIEFGFLDNEEDIKKITDPVWQHKLTEAAATAIKKYLPVENDFKTAIIGNSLLTSSQLKKALKAVNANADTDIVDIYYRLAEIYGMKADLVFLHAMLATNWLKFTGIVKPEQNNFAGLGATESSTGDCFSSVEEGVEAHLQHLYAYSTTASIPTGRRLLDNRFMLVKRGIATYWEDLTGKWAVTESRYGKNVIGMQNNVLELYPVEDQSEETPYPSQPSESSSTHWAKASNDELMQSGLLNTDHSKTLDKYATEGLVMYLINRLRKEFGKNE